MLRYFYFVVPILLYGILIWRNWPRMSSLLVANENQVQEDRSVALIMAGFSFTGALALIGVSSQSRADMTFPIYSIFLSLLLYLSSANTQAYKFSRLHDLIGDGLRDAGHLSLILTLLYLLPQAGLPGGLQTALWAVGMATWLVDLLIRLFIWDTYFMRGGQ